MALLDIGSLQMELVKLSPWVRPGPKCNDWCPYKRRTEAPHQGSPRVSRSWRRHRKALPQPPREPALPTPGSGPPACRVGDDGLLLLRAAQDPLSSVGVPPSSADPHTEALPVAVLGSWAWQCPQVAFCQITVFAPVISWSLPGVRETVRGGLALDVLRAGVLAVPWSLSVHLGH